MLTELFRPKTFHSHKRWKCIYLPKKDEDYTTFASVVSKHCDDSKLSEFSTNNFKRLTFVQDLVSNKNAEIRRRVLNKLKNEPNLTLLQITEDCQRFVSVRQDSKVIEESGVSHIKKKYATKNQINHQLNRVNRRKNKLFYPPNRCFGLGNYIGIRTAHTDLKNVRLLTD